MIIFGSFISLILCFLFIIDLIIVTYWLGRVQMKQKFIIPRWGRILQNLGCLFLAYTGLVIINNVIYITTNNIWGSVGNFSHISSFIIGVLGSLYLIFNTQLIKPTITTLIAFIGMIFSQIILSIWKNSSFQDSEIELILPFVVGLIIYFVLELVIGSKNKWIWKLPQKWQKILGYKSGFCLWIIISLEIILQLEGLSISTIFF